MVVNPLPTGFLLGMEVGGLFILVKPGSGGNDGDLVNLEVTMGDCVSLTIVVVSLGGRGGPEGRESFLTGKITFLKLSKEGGSGRAFERRERIPALGAIKDGVSIIIMYVVRRDPLLRTLKRKHPIQGEKALPWSSITSHRGILSHIMRLGRKYKTAPVTPSKVTGTSGRREDEERTEAWELGTPNKANSV